MKKRLLILAVVFTVLAGMMVGCSGKKDDVGTNGEEVKQEEKTDTELPKEEDTDIEDVSQNIIPIPEGGNVAAVKMLPDAPLRIAFLSFQNNPFWFPVRDGANAAKEYLANFNTTVDYIVMGEDMTADRVTAAIDAAITKEYDAIAVAPVFDGTEIYIDKAVDAGIPVITFVAEGSKPSKRLANVGQDAYAAGELAGQQIEAISGGTGSIGVITGAFGATQHELRMNGALDYLKENAKDIKILEPVENKDKAEVAYDYAKNMITANPDLKVIYVTAGGPFGAAKAVADAGKTGEVSVVCYDHIPENIGYVRTGEIAAAIAQDPFGQGFDSLVFLYNHLVAEEELEEFIPVKLDVLTPENVDELYPEN